MDEQEAIDNDSPNNMEVEASNFPNNEEIHPVSEASASEASQPPVTNSTNLLRTNAMIRLSELGFEVIDAYDTEATYTSDTEESRTSSPYVLEDESNIAVPEMQPKDSSVKSKSPTKKRKLSIDEDDDDGKLCPICFDNWTNTGEHRICSLKCGHLFGLSCVTRWLTSESRKVCPTCKKKVNMRYDIRNIYAKKLIAVDTTEIDIMKKQLEVASEEKNRMQIELTKTICREHMLVQELNDCKHKIKLLSGQLEAKDLFEAQLSSSQNSNPLIRLYMDKSLELSRNGECRVLDYKTDSDVVVVSMKSPNSFFTGYGVRKISLSNYRPTAFIGLHKSQIRDMKFHPVNPWLASVSLDKVIKILDINSNTSIVSYTSSYPLWSCCWDADNPHQLFVGEQQGSVMQYDMRQMTEPVTILFVPGDMTPVVSLAAIKQEAGTAIPHGGVAVCKLNSVWIFENMLNGYTRRHLPIEGPFVSMCYQNSTKQLLVSSRPNNRTAFARHVVCNISKDGEDLRCDTLHSFQGGHSQRMLSRSCFVSNKNDYVSAYHENHRCVYLWNINTGQKSCSVPAHEPVIDMCGLQVNNTNVLMILTERKLEFFKFVE